MITCIIIMIGRTPPPRVYTGTWGAVPAAEPVRLAQADGGGGGEQERDQGTRHITLRIQGSRDGAAPGMKACSSLVMHVVGARRCTSFEAHRLVWGYFGHHEIFLAPCVPANIGRHTKRIKTHPYAHISSGPKHGRRAPRAFCPRVTLACRGLVCRLSIVFFVTRTAE